MRHVTLKNGDSGEGKSVNRDDIYDRVGEGTIHDFYSKEVFYFVYVYCLGYLRYKGLEKRIEHLD